MNRKILFRGKRLDNGEWVYGYYIYKPDPLLPGIGISVIVTFDENSMSVWNKVDPATVGQHTGLTDKNGAEIFDRDIVTATYLDHVYIGTVEYDQAAFWISWQRDCEGRAFLGPSCAIYPIEVIGNIYDNSDMLKEVE